MAKLFTAVLLLAAFAVIATQEVQKIEDCAYSDQYLVEACWSQNTTMYKSWLCDGGKDCPYGEDEQCEGHQCIPRIQFDCGVYEQKVKDVGTGKMMRQCVPISYVCNEEIECKTGADEQGCPKDMFLCDAIGEYGPYQAKKDIRCDGTKDCIDESDELNCKDYKCNPLFQITCNDGTCRTRHRQCDCYKDCPDGEDEKNCGGYPWRADLYGKVTKVNYDYSR